MQFRFCYIILILFVFSFTMFFSCEKINYTTNSEDKLIFSTDSIKFDTVFSSIGSATKRFTVKNSNKKKSIVIDKIFVAKSNNSKYKLNINGILSNNITNIELSPGDSLYIFVMVNINPGRDEMVENDSIIFMSNNNTQSVKLQAFGQDVNLIDGETITNDMIWAATKPYLIYNSALVDTFATLTIQAGTKIYFHKNSSLLVKGTLKVDGTTNNRVLFAGDRLENYYLELPGQWGMSLYDNAGNLKGLLGGIHLLAGSRYNEIHHADIKNSTIGIQVDSCVTPNTPSLILRNSNIENNQLIGLYALGANIEAENCVFANCGYYTVACLIGGKYQFLHCTLANYWKGTRPSSQLVFSNYYSYTQNNSEQISYRPIEAAYFGNCIIYGNKDNEINIDYNQGAEMNLYFENCLIKYKDTVKLKKTGSYINNVFNLNPNFIDTQSPYDYILDTLSAAKDKGKIEIGQLIPFDQIGNSRITDNKPDIGAFERQE